MKKIVSIIWCLLLLPMLVRSREEDHIADYIPLGNLALPTSQQTSALFCFGQNMVDKGDILGYLLLNSFIGNNNNFTYLIPSVLYGISDKFSFLGGLSSIQNLKIMNQRGKNGVESVFAQFEYAFYNNDHRDYANQATFVANIVLPTRSLQSIMAGLAPRPTRIALPDIGVTSFFLGLTANHMATDWYYFISPGFILPASMKKNSSQLSLLYQWGIGRNLYSISHKLILSLLLEFFGTYSMRNKSMDIDSSNIFYIGPSLWLSTQRLTFDIGIAFPVAQTKSSVKNKYYFALEIGWKFNS